MKLRILDNSLRLRLTQSEVATFGAEGRVEARIRFRPGEYLAYVLQASDAVRHLAVRYQGNRIAVLVPSALVAEWVETDRVSLEGTRPLEGDEDLTILIEKDFKCLHGPASRQEEDAFPNPLADG